MIEKIIFDLDGTLVATHPTILKVLGEMTSHKKKLLVNKQRELDKCISLGAEAIIDRFFIVDALKLPLAVSEFRDRYSEQDTTMDYTYSGVRNFLKYFSIRKVELCILTNKPRILALKTLSSTNIQNYFHKIICGDDGFGLKPSLDGLTEIISNTLPSNVIYIGDSQIDMDVANSMKLKYYHHELGYGSLPKNNIFYEKKFGDFNDLLELIK